MLILARDKARDPSLGYARTFAAQFEDCVGLAAQRGVRLVVNAGGLNPGGLAARLRELTERLGLPVRVAHVEGDDLTTPGRRAGPGRTAGRQRLPGRVRDRGVPAGGRGRRRDRPGHRRLAGRRARPRPASAGRAATSTRSPAPWPPGTSSSAARRRPAATTPSSAPSPTCAARGSPSPRSSADGSSVITKPAGHRRRGDHRHGHRAAALRGRRRPLRRARRGAPARLDPAHPGRRGPGADQRRPRRAAAGHAQGRGHRARRLPQRGHVRAHRPGHRGQGRPGAAPAFRRRPRRHDVDPRPHRPRGRRHDGDGERAAALRRAGNRTRTPSGRRFSDAAVHLALGSYPGFHLTAPPGAASPYGVFRSAFVPAYAGPARRGPAGWQPDRDPATRRSAVRAAQALASVPSRRSPIRSGPAVPAGRRSGGWPARAAGTRAATPTSVSGWRTTARGRGWRALPHRWSGCARCCPRPPAWNWNGTSCPTCARST